MTCLVVLASAACENVSLPGWMQAGKSGEAETETATPGAEQIRPDRSVAEAQRMLALLGYEPGPDDGILGQRTGAAVRGYRNDNGLPPGGAVDEQLLRHLEGAVRRYEQRRTVTYRSADRRPVSETGDIYVYSDGTVETVQRTAGGRVWWVNGSGQVDFAYTNFLLPRWRRGRYGTEPPRLSGEPDTLWPPLGGAAVEFEVEFQDPSLGDSPEGADIVQHWHCSVRGKDRVDVPAGRFDSVIIVCNRNPVVEGQWQSRVWHYSPALGHYVRLEDKFADGRSAPRSELVAVRPGGADWPPAARAGLDWALATALDRGAGAKPMEWSSSAVDVSFVIRVTADSKSELAPGSECRTFVEERLPETRRRVFAGLACRNPITERWSIPFLPTPAAGFNAPSQ